MTICLSCGRVRSACGATFAALLLAAALPLAAPTAAEAKRQQGPSHMQREMPAAQAQRQQLSPPQGEQPRGAAQGPVKAEFRAALAVMETPAGRSPRRR